MSWVGALLRGVARRRFVRRTAGTGAAVVAAYGLLRLMCVLVPPPVERLTNDWSTVNLASGGELLRITLSPSGRYRVRLPLSEIPDELKKGFVLAEDKRFWGHPGVDPVAFARAMAGNVRHLHITAGGSTLTMQLAKMMDPRPRTAKAKAIEMFRALQLECMFSKEELLDLYLNSVPMGGNLSGVGAAAYLYYGKPAAALSLSQAAMLVALPRQPTQFRPDVSPKRALAARDRVLRRIGPRLTSDTERLRLAFTEAVPFRRFVNPNDAPHAVLRTASLPGPGVRRLAIQMGLQRRCEALVSAAVKARATQGVKNGAMMVVENRTMRVVAYVGSPSFNETDAGLQINGATVLRSPGSLLKPFVYALGCERGSVTPRRALYDIERNYDGFAPVNFQRRFLGPVPAEETLIQSFNAPAVMMEHEMGGNGLVHLLQEAGFDTDDRDRVDAGLSAVLGSYPMRMEEMCRLYACLANGGVMRELEFIAPSTSLGASGPVGKRLLTEESCYLVTQMLSEAIRTDLPRCWEFTPFRGRVAFKTGTSFGLRDAWCVGYDPEYTVAAWFGNMDGSSSPALVGRGAAAPVVLSFFNESSRYRDRWFARPKGVSERAVCAKSGMAPGPDCAATLPDLFIPGVSSNEPCGIHKRVPVRKKDGVEVCSACMDGDRSDYREAVIEEWPAEVARYLRVAGREERPRPPHNPACARAKNDGGLRIKSPLPGGFYAVTPALPELSQRIPLQAASNAGAEPVTWFVDGREIAAGPPDHTYFATPSPGEHVVSVVDGAGRSASVRVTVRARL